MTDESGQSYPFTIDQLLDKAVGPEEFYGVFTANMHTDSDSSSGSASIVSSALSHLVPVISARQLLQWLDGRNNSVLSGITLNGTTLGFDISVGWNATGLMCMIPIPAGLTLTSITSNGAPVSYHLDTVKGIQYAFFAAASGSYQTTFIR